MLCLVHDPPAVGNLWRIVGAAHLVMKQFASRVSHHTQKLGTAPEQLSGLVELLNSRRERSEECRELSGPFLTVDFVVLCHSHLEGGAFTPVKFG